MSISIEAVRIASACPSSCDYGEAIDSIDRILGIAKCRSHEIFSEVRDPAELIAIGAIARHPIYCGGIGRDSGLLTSLLESRSACGTEPLCPLLFSAVIALRMEARGLFSEIIGEGVSPFPMAGVLDGLLRSFFDVSQRKEMVSRMIHGAYEDAPASVLHIMSTLISRHGMNGELVAIVRGLL